MVRGLPDRVRQYSVSREKEDWSAFRRAVREAKRDFFAERMQEVAVTNMRLWDLMEWVKQRKNPPCEAIQKDGEPCHDLEQLWDALHSTYNAASAVSVTWLPRAVSVTCPCLMTSRTSRSGSGRLFRRLSCERRLALALVTQRLVRTTLRGSTSNALLLPLGASVCF